jgi:hypothetical protein
MDDAVKAKAALAKTAEGVEKKKREEAATAAHNLSEEKRKAHEDDQAKQQDVSNAESTQTSVNQGQSDLVDSAMKRLAKATVDHQSAVDFHDQEVAKTTAAKANEATEKENVSKAEQKN